MYSTYLWCPDLRKRHQQTPQLSTVSVYNVVILGITLERLFYYHLEQVIIYYYYYYEIHVLRYIYININYNNILYIYV